MQDCMRATQSWRHCSRAFERAKGSTSIPRSSKQRWHIQSGNRTSIGPLELLHDDWEPHTAYQLPTRYLRRQVAGLLLEQPINATGNILPARWIVLTCCKIQSLLPTLTVWHI